MPPSDGTTVVVTGRSVEVTSATDMVVLEVNDDGPEVMLTSVRSVPEVLATTIRVEPPGIPSAQADVPAGRRPADVLSRRKVPPSRLATSSRPRMIGVGLCAAGAP